MTVSIACCDCCVAQEYDSQERTVHEFSLRGMYRDGARLQTASFLSKEWWTSRRFFWERGKNYNYTAVPSCNTASVGYRMSIAEAK